MRRALVVAIAIPCLLAGLSQAAAHAQADGVPATEVSQRVSLSEAAAAGIVDLRAKGGIGGDSVAVDLEGARVRGAPVVATVRIEFLGAQSDGRPWPQSKADEIAAAIERRLAGAKASDGTPFRVELQARVRAGADPLGGGTPGYHQIVLTDRPRAADASMVSGSPFGGLGEKSGDWGANETATTWAHETGHLLGLPDRYSARKPDWIGPDGRHVKLPELTGDRNDRAALDRWWDAVQRAAAALDARYGRGDVQPGIPSGSENDIMADGTGAEHAKPLIAGDVDRLVAGAGVRVRASPGDVLVNKASDQQNLVVGAGFELYAPKGGRAHRNGLFAYCVDLSRHAPAIGARFDVLGPASALAGTHPQYAALARVTDEIARRQLDPAVGIAGPPGANAAVWAVTDAVEPTSEEAKAIFAGASVTYDAALFAGSPHFGNPNAGGAATAAVTTTAVVPATPVRRGGAVPDPGRPLPAARLAYLGLASTVVPAGRRGALTLRSLSEGSATRYGLQILDRRGRVVRLPRGTPATLTIPIGPDLHAIGLPRLRPGTYVLMLVRTGAKARRLWFRALRTPARASRSGCGGRSCRGRRSP